MNKSYLLVMVSRILVECLYSGYSMMSVAALDRGHASQR